MKSFTASIRKISDIIKKDVDVLDKTGNVIYSSNPLRLGITIDDFEKEYSMPLDKWDSLYIHIEDGSFEEIGLAQLILQDNLYEGTAGDYQQFLINILEGNNMPDSYYKKFNMPVNGSYIVYCINLPSNEHFYDSYSLILNSFDRDDYKWIVIYENDIVVVEYTGTALDDETKHTALMIKDTINTELYTDVYIGLGNIHEGIFNIKKSLDEAKEAIRIGKMYNLPDNIYIFKDMLIERIVSLIPDEKAEELVQGVFKDNFENIFDDEMLRTVEVFFRNNLNVSDSSRILYIHRNTLLYRLDKIQKNTGLDIRKFEDAVTFKISFLLKSRRKI